MIVRYDYMFKQVEEQLQIFALNVLQDTVKMIADPYMGEINVVIDGGAKVRKLKVDLYEFRFYARHVSVSFKVPKAQGLSKEEQQTTNGKAPLEEINFQIEEKLYRDSPHNSKITFWANDAAAEKERKEKVMQFLEQLMGDIKPEMRFTLAKYGKTLQKRKKVAVVAK